MGEIFGVSFGKYNLPQSPAARCIFAGFIFTYFCLSVNILDAINIFAYFIFGNICMLYLFLILLFSIFPVALF